MRLETTFRGGFSMLTRCLFVLSVSVLATGSLWAQEKTSTTVKEPIYAEKSISAWINDLKVKDSTPGTRLTALAVLERLGPRDEAAIPYLVEALHVDKVTPAGGDIPGRIETRSQAYPENRRDIGVSRPAAYALGRIGHAAVPALIKALREHPDAGGVVVALGRVGPSAVPAPVELLKGNKDVRVRSGAVQALGQLGDDGAAGVPALVQALDDADIQVQQSACKALRSVEVFSKNAVPVLLQRLKHKDPATRTSAALTLGCVVGQPAVARKRMSVVDGSDFLDAGLVKNVVRTEVGPLAKVAVPHLVELLADPVADVRTGASHALFIIGWEAKAAVPALKKAMNDEELPIAQAMALSQMGPDGISVLLDWAKSREKMKANEDRRFGDRLLLAMVIPLTAISARKDAMPLLLELLKRSDFLDKEQAMSGLVLIGAEAKQAAPILGELLKPGAWHDPIGLALLLNRIEPGSKAAVSALKKLLDEPPTRVDAGHALRRIAPDEAKKLLPPISAEMADLIKKLDPSNWLDFISAAGEVAKIGPEAKAAVPALIDALKIGGNAGSVAQGTLGSIGSPAVPSLVAALKSQDVSIRLVVIQLLGRIGADAKDAAPELAKALKDPRPAVRLAAAESIGRIGPGARSAAASLTEAVTDSDADVRHRAREALTRIAPEDSPKKDR
jgi:HEAT repeat protein